MISITLNDLGPGAHKKAKYAGHFQRLHLVGGASYYEAPGLSALSTVRSLAYTTV
jgi:hypothetical protein